MLKRVAVVGAGISGLTAGYALQKIGLEVDIFERSQSITEFGAGITLSRNATSLLEELGLMELLSKKGYFPMASYIRDYKNANVISAMKFDESFITLDRRDLVEQLAQSFEEIGGKIHYGTEVQSINPSSGAIQISDENINTYELILLSDGIKSSFRKEHFDNQEPQFTNYVAWRGMTTSDLLPQFEGSEKVNVYHGPGGHCVHYPTGREGLINFVAIEHNLSWAEESWKVEGNKSDFLKCFQGWNEDLLLMLNSTEKLYKWGIFERPLPSTLHQGKCVLLGDAAHPMVPFLGQGGCLAIEDAYCLMVLLGEIEDLDKALSAYDQLRNKRAKWMQKRSKLQGLFNHISNPLLASARNLVTKATMKISVENIHSYNPRKELSSILK